MSINLSLSHFYLGCTLDVCYLFIHIFCINCWHLFIHIFCINCWRLFVILQLFSFNSTLCIHFTVKLLPFKQPLNNIYTEPKWKLFIIRISNTILNQCISLCLYKNRTHNKGNKRVALNLKSFIMHNREITHIVKTDSLSKNEL